jgi:hypothetical protein
VPGSDVTATLISKCPSANKAHGGQSKVNAAFRCPEKMVFSGPPTAKIPENQWFAGMLRLI